MHKCLGQTSQAERPFLTLTEMQRLTPFERSQFMKAMRPNGKIVFVLRNQHPGFSGYDGLGANIFKKAVKQVVRVIKQPKRLLTGSKRVTAGLLTGGYSEQVKHRKAEFRKATAKEIQQLRANGVPENEIKDYQGGRRDILRHRRKTQQRAVKVAAIVAGTVVGAGALGFGPAAGLFGAGAAPTTVAAGTIGTTGIGTAGATGTGAMAAGALKVASVAAPLLLSPRGAGAELTGEAAQQREGVAAQAQYQQQEEAKKAKTKTLLAVGGFGALAFIATQVL